MIGGAVTLPALPRSIVGGSLPPARPPRMKRMCHMHVSEQVMPTHTGLLEFFLSDLFYVSCFCGYIVVQHVHLRL